MEYIRSAVKYFFARNPGQNFEFYTEFIILIAALLVAAVAFSQIYRRRKKYDFAFKRIFGKVANRLTLLAILLTVLIIFRYENIPYFSMRILLYLAILLLLYFIYQTVKKFKVDYPREKQNISNKPATAPENKYLPNKKKKH